MGPAELVFLIPITAIVLGIGSKIVSEVLSSQERRLEMRMRLKQGGSDQMTTQIAELRAEIASLRDTSHQFDLSFDETLTRMEQRVWRLETKSATSAAVSSTTTETPQTLTNG
jgi:TolA-binding protein